MGDWKKSAKQAWNALTGPAGSRPLPKEKFNQDTSVNPFMAKIMRFPGTKAGAYYNPLNNSISYPKGPETYLNPFHPDAETRHHEWQHWRQSGGLLNNIVFGTKYVGNALVRGYENIPAEVEARTVAEKSRGWGEIPFRQQAQKFIDDEYDNSKLGEMLYDNVTGGFYPARQSPQAKAQGFVNDEHDDANGIYMYEQAGQKITTVPPGQPGRWQLVPHKFLIKENDWDGVQESNDLLMRRYGYANGGMVGIQPQQLLEYAVIPSGMEDTALKGIIAANMDKDFVQRVVTQNPTVSRSIPLPDGKRATHQMASGDGRVYPMIYNTPQGLQRLQPGMAPPESINFGNDIAAQWFANNYKRVNPQGFENGGLVSKEGVMPEKSVFSQSDWDVITRTALTAANTRLGVADAAQRFNTMEQGMYSGWKPASAQMSDPLMGRHTPEYGTGFARGGLVDGLNPFGVIGDVLSGITPQRPSVPVGVQQLTRGIAPRQDYIPASPTRAPRATSAPQKLRGNTSGRTKQQSPPQTPPAMSYTGPATPAPAQVQDQAPMIDTGKGIPSDAPAINNGSGPQNFTGSISTGSNQWDGSFGYEGGGLIPGEVNPGGDDTMIPAKQGEYVIPVEVVQALGKETFDELVYNVKRSMGLDEPPKGMIPGAPEEEGYAQGGYYETDPYKIGDTTTLPGALRGMVGAAAGWVGNQFQSGAQAAAAEHPENWKSGYELGLPSNLPAQASGFAAAQEQRYAKPSQRPSVHNQKNDPAAFAASLVPQQTAAATSASAGVPEQEQPAKAKSGGGKPSRSKGKRKGNAPSRSVVDNRAGSSADLDSALNNAQNRVNNPFPVRADDGMDDSTRTLKYPDGGGLRISYGHGGGQQPTFYDTPAGQLEMLYKTLRKNTYGGNDLYAGTPLSEAEQRGLMAQAAGMMPSVGNWVAADANRYTADRRLEGDQIQLRGTRYTADRNLEGNRYTADRNYEGTKYHADRGLEGTKYTADLGLQGTREKNAVDLKLGRGSDGHGGVKETPLQRALRDELNRLTTAMPRLLGKQQRDAQARINEIRRMLGTQGEQAPQPGAGTSRAAQFDR